MEEAKLSFEYYHGYSNGFKEGYNKALEHFKDKTTQIIIIDKEEILEKTCKDKCYLYNKKYCRLDGLVLFDATTCKNYHTEESFKSFIDLLADQYFKEFKCNCIRKS